jgi:hypothetical protein
MPLIPALIAALLSGLLGQARAQDSAASGDSPAVEQISPAVESAPAAADARIKSSGL